MIESLGPDEEVPLETLLARVKREGGEMLAAMRRKEFAPNESIAAWRTTAARGERARAFLASEFWRMDLAPFLRVESHVEPSAADALPASLEQATIKYLDRSGAARLAGRIEKTMRGWVSEGEKAAKFLRIETEKRKPAIRPQK